MIAVEHLLGQDDRDIINTESAIFFVIPDNIKECAVGVRDFQINTESSDKALISTIEVRLVAAATLRGKRRENVVA